MSTMDEAVRAAIAAIDSFLQQTAHSSSEINASQLRALAYRIEQARDLRTYTSTSGAGDAGALKELYRNKLEQLRERLTDCQRELCAESDRLAEDNTRLTCVRAWHEQFTATQ